jgi:hypothetical protein
MLIWRFGPLIIAHYIGKKILLLTDLMDFFIIKVATTKNSFLIKSEDLSVYPFLKNFYQFEQFISYFALLTSLLFPRLNFWSICQTHYF